MPRPAIGSREVSLPLEPMWRVNRKTAIRCVAAGEADCLRFIIKRAAKVRILPTNFRALREQIPIGWIQGCAADVRKLTSLKKGRVPDMLWLSYAEGLKRNSLDCVPR